jgi:DNA mismatch repair ATPase MutS
MKAYLMHEDEDFDLRRPLPGNADELIHDLDLTTLFAAMALGDKFLFEVSKAAMLSGLDDPDAVIYRQHVLTDCIEHPEIIREMYAIAVEAIEGERKIWRSSRHPSGVLQGSVDALQLFVGMLKRLRQLAGEHATEVRSEGLTRLFRMVQAELDDEYFRTIDDHLRTLKFRGGVLISAELGKGNKGVGYVLRVPKNLRGSWKERMGIGNRSSYSYEVAPRDEAGAQALQELRDRGVNLVANALAQSTDHILNFFIMVRLELGFYVSCLNLRERLVEKGEPLCTPVPLSWEAGALSFTSLYDVCLTLRTEPRVVGNDANADGRQLVMITGANSGGKSTFLRSVGMAQLMMQCGMFVAAQAFHSSVGGGMFTHFIREEDPSMTSGRLDEELSRMNVIAEQIMPHGIVLLNESFAATNEREGSEIARQIVRALLESDIKIVFVTHLFDLAESLHLQQPGTTLFLRAERNTNGRQHFKLVEGAPLPTSFGEDVYKRLGGWMEAP